jgi:hypothetical protein
MYRMTADMGNRAHPIFAANIRPGSVTRYFIGRKGSGELQAGFNAPEIEGAQSVVREAYVGRRDSDFKDRGPSGRPVQPAA